MWGNLLLGKRTASNDEIITACERAGISDYINELPDGINTVIGKNGIGLSGGQKQRLATARIYLKNPKIIIFDEAISSLDRETEEKILEACKKAYIYDFIEGLPNGLDTVIGERGIKLSGGQRHRIVLARLFLLDVDIFIFDEATSALDQYSENIVHDAIKISRWIKL